MEKIKGIHNFRHKNIYLSYGEYRAVTYATSTEYGSEILTRIIDLYRLLKNKSRTDYNTFINQCNKY